VIFDEVFIGLHRLGFLSAGPVLGVHPDISANAKILTGGLLPLATTLARESIFETFVSDKKVDALLHGHSYTAFPVGCAVANKTLDLLENLSNSGAWLSAKEQWDFPTATTDSVGAWSFWSPKFLLKISKHPDIREVMSLGTVLAVKFKAEEGYTSFAAQNSLVKLLSIEPTSDGTIAPTPDGSPSGVHYRTLGNVAYFIGSLTTDDNTYRNIENRIISAIGDPE